MAKKIKAQEVPREERPEFLAALDALPADEAERIAYARRAADLFNDAVYIGDESQVAAAVLMFEAAVYRMNGDKFFGCAAEDGSQTRLFAELAAVPGQVPGWSQAGQYLLTVDGVQMLVTVKPNSLGGVIYVDLDALNLDAPFVSSTGFRNLMLWPDAGMGQTFAQAVRGQVKAVLVEQGGPVAIGADEFFRQKPRKPPAWVAAALAAVAGNGQMAMFAEESAEPVKAPLSGAARQKRRRDKLRELKEKEGLKPVLLTDAERRQLFAALDLENSIKPNYAPAERLTLLNKVCPGAAWTNEAGVASPTGDRVLDEAFERPAHIGPAHESLRNLVLICTLRKRNSEHAELVRAVERLGKRLLSAGLDPNPPSVSQKGGVYHWNQNPPIDYRATDPKGDSTPHLTAVDEYFFRPEWMRE